MTDDRDILDRAREALDGITPGEWTYRDIIDGKHNVTVDMWDVASCSGGPIEDDEERTKYAAANAEFIAAAPHLVRVLLATIECERISHQRTVDAYHRASGAEVAWRSNAEGWQDFCEQFGIWGGLNERQLRALRKQMREQGAPR